MIKQTRTFFWFGNTDTRVLESHWAFILQVRLKQPITPTIMTNRQTVNRHQGMYRCIAYSLPQQFIFCCRWVFTFNDPLMTAQLLDGNCEKHEVTCTTGKVPKYTKTLFQFIFTAWLLWEQIRPQGDCIGCQRENSSWLSIESAACSSVAPVLFQTPRHN